jgi:hypothetical protein
MRYSVLPNPQRTQVSPMTTRPSRLCIVGRLGGQGVFLTLERSNRETARPVQNPSRSTSPARGTGGRGPPHPPRAFSRSSGRTRAFWRLTGQRPPARFCGSPENTAGQDAETCGERKAGDCGGVAAAAEQKGRPPPGREFLNPYDQKAPSPAVLRCRALGVTPHPLGGVEARARFGILAREPAGNLDRIDTDSSRGHAASAASP